MYCKGLNKDTVLFSLSSLKEGARAFLAGDFSGWAPVPMNSRGDGRFEAIVPLRRGDHQYKFILDGRWTKDPENSSWAMSSDGTLNSVAHVD